MNQLHISADLALPPDLITKMEGSLTTCTLRGEGQELHCHECQQVTRDRTQVALLYCPTCEVFHVPRDASVAFEQGKVIGAYLKGHTLEELRAGRGEIDAR